MNATDEFIRLFCNATSSVSRDLKSGRDPNLPDKYGWIALHRAATSSSVKIAKMLIEAGSDLPARGTEGWTPLHLAAAAENKHVLALLVQAGADANPSARSGSLGSSGGICAKPVGVGIGDLVLRSELKRTATYWTDDLS